MKEHFADSALCNADILVVEDNDDLASVLQESLQERGGRVQVARSFSQAKRLLEGQNFHAMVLDIRLPGGESGTKLLMQLRRAGRQELPILVLSSLAASATMRAEHLHFGADDVMSKPVYMDECCARLERLLQSRSKIQKTNEGSDGIRLRQDASAVEFQGKSVPLAPCELRILSVLITNAGKTCSREQLQKAALLRAGSQRSLDVHIMRLRKKIGQEKIRTVWGRGFLYVED